MKKVTADCARHYSSGEFEKAEAAYTELLDKYRRTGEQQSLALVYNNRGHAKYMQVEFYTAKEDFDMATSLNPELGSAFYNRATILYRMGNFSEALTDFQQSVKIEPTNLEFQEGLNNCHQCSV